MIKRMFKITWVAALAVFTFFLTSCDKENTISEEIVENFVDESVEAMDRSGSMGRGGCFELVFPITVDFPDGTSSEVDSYETLRGSIRSWKEANTESEERPSLAFPIEVVGQEGELISITSSEELRELRQTCRRNFIKNNKKKDRCFKLVFPISLNYPDGTTTEYPDRRAMKQDLRAWKQANPDAEERPSLVFPVDVELEDGTIVSIASAEELQAQKDSCAAEDGQ